MEDTNKAAKFDPKGRLEFADGLRGLAALWVVLFHLFGGGHIKELTDVLPQWVVHIVFQSGELGVTIFFVLSGFVMMLTLNTITVNQQVAMRFIARRLVRLAPPYYAAIVLVLLLLWVKSRALHVPFVWPDFWVLLTHVTFTQDITRVPQLNIVFWTLCIEVQFYLAFAALVWLADVVGQKMRWASARSVFMLLAALLAWPWSVGWLISPGWPGGFLGHWYIFMLGVMACRFFLRSDGATWAAPAYCALVLAGGVYVGSEFAVVAAGTATLLMVSGWLGTGRVWLNQAGFQWLGMISYSLYLLHNPITGAVSRVAKYVPLHSWLAASFVGFAALAACLFGAWLCYLLVERPSIDWSKRVRFKASARA